MVQKDCRNSHCIEGWIWKQTGEFPDGPCPDCSSADGSRGEDGPYKVLLWLRRILRR
jgi:hypothetical protein